MRYQDLRRPRGAGEFWLQLRLWLARPFPAQAPIGRLDGLSEHQLKDLGLASCRSDTDPLPFWRLSR